MSLYCSSPNTASGYPCQNKVKAEGERCWIARHQDTPPSPPPTPPSQTHSPPPKITPRVRRKIYYSEYEEDLPPTAPITPKEIASMKDTGTKRPGVPSELKRYPTPVHSSIHAHPQYQETESVRGSKAPSNNSTQKKYATQHPHEKKRNTEPPRHQMREIQELENRLGEISGALERIKLGNRKMCAARNEDKDAGDSEESEVEGEVYDEDEDRTEGEEEEYDEFEESEQILWRGE